MHLSREVKLSITVLSAFIILIWGINFLRGRSFFEKNSFYYGVYDKVDGLKVSSAVLYRGYGVGQVIAIDFIGERYDRVLVKFFINKDLRIPKNSTALIENADLMGTKALNIVPGDSYVYAESGDTLIAGTSMGIFAQLNKEIVPLKERAIRLMSSLDTVIMLAQDVFNTQTRDNINQSIENLRNTFSNVERATGGLDRLIASESQTFSSILDNVNVITSNLKNNQDVMNQGIENFRVISDSVRKADLKATADILNCLLRRADSLFSGLNKGEGSLGAFMKNEELYYNLNTAVYNINSLLREIEYNPKRFLHFSLIDFSSGKKKTDKLFGVSIMETEKRLERENDIYRNFSNIHEIVKDGKYYYVVNLCNSRKRAEKNLISIKEKYPKASIVILE